MGSEQDYERERPISSDQQIELELVLIRHGYTQWNIEHRYLGKSDLPLLPEEQEKLISLRKQPELEGHFWRVYSSDLRRCKETLFCITPQLVSMAIYDRRLREISFGVWEGHTYDQLKDNPDYRDWIDDPAAVTPPEGEVWHAFEDRLKHFLDDLFHAAEAELVSTPHDEADNIIVKGVQNSPLRLRVLIVTHGGVIRQLMTQALESSTFYGTAAPPPGTVAAIKLVRSVRV